MCKKTNKIISALLTAAMLCSVTAVPTFASEESNASGNIEETAVSDKIIDEADAV